MPQQEQERQNRVITRPSNREPRRYRVNVLNDDFTTFEFVIMVMMTVFNKTMSEAEDIAETVLYVANLPQRAVVEDVTVWGIDKQVNPL